ncbi:MAG TPA: S41 family peptidase [Symbiobacteriaceae bacterium]|nr:S41 family peptidase [Symbiobacteriaceae bacterium]
MHWKLTAITLLASASLLVVPAPAAVAAPSEENLSTLTRVFTLLVEQHYARPDEEELLQGAIAGMLDVLDDPYTSYLTPKQYDELTDAVNANYAGIGAVLRPGPDRDALEVVEVYAGSPAARAGIQAGDRILAVDGTRVTPENIGGMPGRIRGGAGTTVRLDLERGETLAVTRAEVELPTVTHQAIDANLHYIRLLTFGNRTAGEFARSLAEAERSGAKGLVLDLRGNSGGYVLAAMEIADALMESGTIINIPLSDGSTMPILAEPGASALPVSVLVDGDSASASEILAGALQVNGRARLVGRRTFGKGTMQAPEELPNGGILKLSVARWELADGTSPDFVGLKPDVQVQNDDLAMGAAIQAVVPQRSQRLTLGRRPGFGVLNGHDLPMAPAVVEVDGQTYVPLRYTMEALGSEVRYRSDSQSVQFVFGEHAFLADLKTGVLATDGAQGVDPSAVRLIDGKAYLTPAAVAQVTGGQVHVEDRAVVVQTP